MAFITEFDAFLFGEGTHRRAYEKLGAHPTCEAGRNGVRFAVWAPSAADVSAVGVFNNWQPDANPLQPAGVSGIWEGFVPGAEVGSAYKFAIHPRDSDIWLEKADPYARAAEMRPKTASIVADVHGYVWNDADWLRTRGSTDWGTSPVSIYEVHLGSWRRDPSRPQSFLSYRELAEQLPEYVRDMGYTHIELMPITEHPLDLSWGYQTTGYFAPTARFGGPSDFLYFIDSCHQAGLGVLLDWVPAHFPKDGHGLARFDGSCLYEHADPRQGEHPDWGTLIFNYGRHEVRTFLISSALFWLGCYHIDGLRVDAVASMLYLDYSRPSGDWVPNRHGGRENLDAIDFLRDLNNAVHQQFPDALMIAEESTAWAGVTRTTDSGGLGFDLKWNMGWMHDTLEYMVHDPINRKYHQNELTFSANYAFSERFLLPLSHDEVVHGKRSLLDKMPGDEWQKFANLRLLLGYMYAHPGKKLLFMGGEFGQWREWDHAQSLDWHLLEDAGIGGQRHRGLNLLVRDLNRLYRESPALHRLDFDAGGFSWIDFLDSEASVIAFQRMAEDERSSLVVACNFTPVVRHGYRLGLPRRGTYLEVLNTDAIAYGGSGIVNKGKISSEDLPWQAFPYSCVVALPPLAVLVLAPD